MALIYTITFPQNPFESASRRVTGVDEPPESFASADPNIYISNRGVASIGITSYDLSAFRDYSPPTDLVDIPKQDITSTSFKVVSRPEENKSKITYDLGLTGETAREIIRYINFIRLPGGDSAYPEPVGGIEHLFNLDKQLKITISDDCCPILVNGRGYAKPILVGYIPLNSVRYCLDDGCSLNCTIYEDSKRVNAIQCIESTVLGVKSNIGKLIQAEVETDRISTGNTGRDTTTKFATVPAKWFDTCVEPTSTGTSLILLNLIGFIKMIILAPLVVLFAVIFVLVSIINLIIRAINIVPGINIRPLSILGFDSSDGNPFSSAVDLIDYLLGIERMVEGLFGCKYIKGGYRVASIISTICSECGFSLAELNDYTTNPISDIPRESIKTPVTTNSFKAWGNLDTESSIEDPVKNELYNTAYIPAEDSYTRREEKKLLKEKKKEGLPRPVFEQNVGVRAASIETTDKVLDRLSSLWDTNWGVVNTPTSNADGDTPNGIQLQLGPLTTRYSFQKEEIVDLVNNGAPVHIKDAEICYDFGQETYIGYETTWIQDSSDNSASKQLKAYRGYLSYQNNQLKDRKPSKVKTNTVQFTPAHYIDSIRNDSLYDDFREGRTEVLGFDSIDEYFESGQLIMGSEFTSVPKLVSFKVEGTRVLDDRRACRLNNDNRYFTPPHRMADIVDTTFVSSSNTFQFLTEETGQLSEVDYTHSTGIQPFIPYYSTGYLSEGKSITIPNIILIGEDFLSKYSSSEVGYSEAESLLRSGGASYLGPFTNLVGTQRQVINDNTGYNFSPLMDFSIEKLNFECGDDDLMNQCLNDAVVFNRETGYQLRLVRLNLGLGVITSLEIDYANRNIKAEGYVISFYQDGVNLK